MIKINKIIPVIITATVFLSGCAAAVSGTTTDTKTKDTTAAVTTTGESKGTITTEEYDALQKEYNDYKSDKETVIADLNKKIADLSSNNAAPDNSALAFKDRPSGMLYFPIFSKTPQDMAETVVAYAEIEPQLSVEDKVTKLTKALTSTVFNGQTIETSIVADGSKKILKVNLVGREAWSPVFQGSTGGSINSFTIIETYLQKQYKNDWINSVEVTVDGKVPHFEHAPALDGSNDR
ncbi:MAG: hypothetical protein QMB63_06140 [Clostridiaceae bacterium]